MDKVLNVRRVGFLQDMPGDSRSPESFAFPACLTSLLECIGEDVLWETIHAHNREWTQRFVNKQILAASGMAFGLLWSPEICPSSFDLMQVNEDHADTIRLGFAYVGRECQIIGAEAGAANLRRKVVESIGAGVPALAFGIGGNFECSILCGYENNGERILGWNHFQKEGMQAELAENGMFRLGDWEKDVWTLALCGEKKKPDNSLRGVIERGLRIMERSETGGYLAGEAAYDAWIAYVSDAACRDMDDAALRQRYWFHHVLTGNHAEARCYLGNYLSSEANGDKRLMLAAQCMDDIHSACWRLWGVAGGISAPDGYLCLRGDGKRLELAQIIGEIRALDRKALDAMKHWLA